MDYFLFVAGNTNKVPPYFCMLLRKGKRKTLECVLLHPSFIQTYLTKMGLCASVHLNI